MPVSFDPAKREWTLVTRGLDFADADEVFDGMTIDFEDDRRDYGETRMVTIGLFRSRMVVVAWTPRAGKRHVFSMRKANDREQAKYRERLEQG